jgi:hypothetical protein
MNWKENKMKDLAKWVGKLLFWVMAAALVAYAASRTLDFVSNTLSGNDQVVGYLTLFATTGGAIAWLMVFLYNSEGIAQKGIALVMVVLDVLGEIALFTVDTLMQSGNNGMMAALAPEEIRTAVLGMSALIGLNIIATFAFHIFEPENMEKMQEHMSEMLIREKINKAKREKAEAVAGEIAEREALAYGELQKAKDRSDKRVDERTSGSIFGGFFGKNKETATMPLSADTSSVKLLDEDDTGTRIDLDDPVYYHADGRPRYHPALGLKGKRWVTVEGERVLVSAKELEKAKHSFRPNGSEPIAAD